MADRQLGAIINSVRRIVRGRSGCTLSDAQLLENFVTGHDEWSFELLVWRHGAMVLSLCRRVLRDRHEAEDAFQAAFLVFARKAGSIGKREALGSWLYKVAYRIALRARAAKRSAPQEVSDDLPAPEVPADLDWRDLRPILDAEIHRLPEKDRAAFVLCYLEGCTNEEAARQLGCPKGTILSRLARARERLRSRLTGRGFALSAAGILAALSENASAAAPAGLVRVTVQAAVPFAAGTAAPELISASVAALTEGVLHTMFLTKLNIVRIVLLALALVIPGAGFIAQGALGQPPAAPKEKPVAEGPRDLAPGKAAPGQEKAPQLVGTVVAVTADGQGVTLDTRPAKAPFVQRSNIKLADNTQITYSGVGPDGARLTEGYSARVWLVDGSPDVAARINLSTKGNARQRSADLAGVVARSSPDGKTITCRVAAPSRGGDAGKMIDVRLSEKTVVSYSFVAWDGARPTAGYHMAVYLEHGSKDAAAAVDFSSDGTRPLDKFGSNKTFTGIPDRAGKVVAAAPDGKTFAVEAPSKSERPVRWEIKTDDKTKAAFHNVAPDGARPIEGYLVQVWLAEGSLDVAARVSFQKERLTVVRGLVAAVTPDGRSITLALTPPKGDGGEARTMGIKFADTTNAVYSSVGPGGARPTRGYRAEVWLERGSLDTADRVLFTAPDAGKN